MNIQGIMWLKSGVMLDLAEVCHMQACAGSEGTWIVYKSGKTLAIIESFAEIRALVQPLTAQPPASNLPKVKPGPVDDDTTQPIQLPFKDMKMPPSL